MAIDASIYQQIAPQYAPPDPLQQAMRVAQLRGALSQQAANERLSPLREALLSAQVGEFNRKLDAEKQHRQLIETLAQQFGTPDYSGLKQNAEMVESGTVGPEGAAMEQGSLAAGGMMDRLAAQREAFIKASPERGLDAVGKALFPPQPNQSSGFIKISPNQKSSTGFSYIDIRNPSVFLADSPKPLSDFPYAASLVQGQDQNGNPIFVQPSRTQGVAPRVVQGITPLPKGGKQSAVSPQGVIDDIDTLVEMLQANPDIAGGRGFLSRAYESVSGAIDPTQASSPAHLYESRMTDLKNKLQLLKNDRRFSKFSYEKMDKVIQGLGLGENAGMSIETLNDMKDKLTRELSSGGTNAGGNAPSGNLIYKGHRFPSLDALNRFKRDGG